MHKIYFLSDLHLLASRSHGDQYFETMVSLGGSATDFVLGGDVFDFRWSTMKTVRESVDAAIEWLDSLVSRCPNCQFHYILGNHDYYHRFIEELDELAGRRENLVWHRFYHRMDGNIFIHGDVADEEMDAEKLAIKRDGWLHHKPRGPLLSLAYDVVVWSRVHVHLPHLAYPKGRVAERILHYLNAIGQGPDDGVKNVYFGHTHVPLSGYEYGGLLLHNSGATIKGVKFEILEVLRTP